MFKVHETSNINVQIQIIDTDLIPINMANENENNMVLEFLHLDNFYISGEVPFSPKQGRNLFFNAR